ncbi:APC family permease [Lentilactobacillus hilgardii]|uniref:APC family permease n=1 Tax=Lentilactobacillus hilgardii TaxID=1588 RepID=UPI0021C35399|nr:APC family permease [Lentilactobacillus hilgardii]MCP9334329.1 APC family permease [Lentilactobacillus hilgardii]MCP9350912.1 APC family permease [Lentilactobacillus hilgardii]MCP9353788.1 APC family permease [Lentilactobacillus hilgardii]
MTATTKKQLSFLSVFLLGVDGIIGSGIFLMPSRIYAKLGDVSLLLMPLAGLAVLMIALCFANLASKIPGDGGAWLYTYTAFGRFAGFEIGIFTWLLGIITMATEISALVTSLKSVFPTLNQHSHYLVVALLILGVLTLLNLIGSKFMDWVDNISTIAKVGVLILFVIAGLFFIHPANFSNLSGTVSNSAPLFNRFNEGFGMVFYMFTGFSFLPIAASKMKKPEKTLPIALISVLLTSALLYMIVQMTAIGVSGQDLATDNVPIAASFFHFAGQLGYDLALIGMLISILGVALSISFSTPLIASSLASEHQLLPRVLGHQDKRGVPIVSLLLSCGICALMLLSGNYLFLASCIVFTSFVQYVPTILASIRLQNHTKLPKGFRLPGGLLIPILALLVTSYLILSFSVKLMIAGIIVFTLSGVWYLYDDRDRQAKGLPRDIAGKDKPF